MAQLDCVDGSCLHNHCGTIPTAKCVPILQSTMHLSPLLGNGDLYLFLHAHVALTILELLTGTAY
jgi:hypothetical protein